MKRIFLLFLVAAITVLSPPSYAARQNIAAGSFSLSVDGSLSGVDITGISTLLVDTSIVATPDIFTLNTALLMSDLAVSTTASQGTIWFKNSSTVYGDIGTDGARFLDIQADDGTTVNFLGSVFTTQLHVGTGTMNFASGLTNPAYTNTAAGGITYTGDGTISLAADTTLIGAITTNTDQTGTLSLGSGSRLDGAVGGPGAAAGLKEIEIVGDNASATITGAVNAYTFSLGNNTLNIGGTLTMADNSGPGGVINTTLSSPSVYGHIVPTGAASLGGNVAVNVTVPSTVYIPVGTPFNIIDATSGTDNSVVTVTVQNPTNPLYTFSPDPLAGTTAGTVTIKTTAIPIQVPLNPVVPLPVVAPIAAPVAKVLVNITTPTPDLTEVLAAINALSVPADVVNAEAQLAPSTPSLAVPLVTFQGIRQFQNLWSSRLDMCRPVSEPNEKKLNGPYNEPRSGWWLKGFGYVGDQDAQGAFGGYDSKIFGTMVAYDVPLGLNTRAGLGLGYARTTIDGKTFDTSTDFDTYRATAYIGHESGPWFVYSSASLGWSEYSGMRHIVYPSVDRTANAKYSGRDYGAFVSTGYHFSARTLMITPLASLQYTRMHIGHYTETGAGDINLKVQSQNYNFLESGLGVKVERYFRPRAMTYVPEVHFNWFHELSNPTVTQTAEFAAGSSSFTTPGLKVDDDTFNVGGGLTLLSCADNSATSWSIEAVYDYNWRNDGYSANRGILRLTNRF